MFATVVFFGVEVVAKLGIGRGVLKDSLGEFSFLIVEFAYLAGEAG